MIQIIEQIHNQTEKRTFVCDQKYTEETHISMFDLRVQISSRNLEVSETKLMRAIYDLPLVHEVTLGRRELTVEIQRGFELDEDNWGIIREGVLNKIADYFGITYRGINYTLQNRTTAAWAKLEEEKIDPSIRQVMTIFGLHDQLKKFVISHDFRTHKDAWRKAIEIALANANAGMPTSNNDDGINTDADIAYWEHELAVFDAAFNDLLALNLPEK